MFRLIDDTINGYLALRPSRVAVRLDWGEHRLGVIDPGGLDRGAPDAGRGVRQLACPMTSPRRCAR